MYSRLRSSVRGVVSRDDDPIERSRSRSPLHNRKHSGREGRFRGSYRSSPWDVVKRITYQKHIIQQKYNDMAEAFVKMWRENKELELENSRLKGAKAELELKIAPLKRKFRSLERACRHISDSSNNL